MHFGITEKLTMDCISLYNNYGLISKVSEQVKTLKTAVVDIISLANLREHPHKSYIPRNQSLPYISGANSYGSIFIPIFVVGSERRIFSATEGVSTVQGHPRSWILAPIERAYVTSY